MLRRFRQFLTLVSLALLAGVLMLWAHGDALVVQSMLHIDARSYVLVRHGALNVEHTGLYYTLRDARRARVINFAVERFERLPSKLQTSANEAGPFTFRWASEFTHRVPLQELMDADGKSIYLQQSAPMKLLTLPVWLLVALLAIAPGRAFVRRLRGPRAGWLSQVRYLRRRGVAVCTWASIVICLAWIVSMYRPASYYESEDGLSYHLDRFGSASGTIYWWKQQPMYADDWQIPGEFGIVFKRESASDQHFVASIGLRNELSAVDIPYWLLLSLTAFVPMTWLAMRFWGHQQKDGHCAYCDYDLRYSTERCPECGQPITTTLPHMNHRRLQAAQFALAAILLLFAGTMAAAWAESGNTPSVLYFMGHRSQNGVWLAIEAGKLEAFHGGRITNNARPKTLMSVPAWIPTLALLAASAALIWNGRRAALPAGMPLVPS